MLQIGIPNHNSGITTSLVKIIYQICTKDMFDFGEYVLEQVLKQAESYVVKLHIGVPALIS